MPEEESEDESDTESHEPSHEHERCAFDVGKMAQDRHPFGDLASRLGEYFALSNEWKIKLLTRALVGQVRVILCPAGVSEHRPSCR